jgi:hypothetical protein
LILNSPAEASPGELQGGFSVSLAMMVKSFFFLLEGCSGQVYRCKDCDAVR